MKSLLAILLLLSSALVPAQPTTIESGSFEAMDIFVDSKDQPLAAYQLEFKATSGDVKIVGIEGGEHAAFAEAPHYDPKAMQQERVIIAAFSTADALPVGKTRVATIHVQVSGTLGSKLELKFHAAADARGNAFQAQASFEQRKPQ